MMATSVARDLARVGAFLGMARPVPSAVLTDRVPGVDVAGDDDADDIGPALADLGQELHAARLRHPLVGEDHLNPLGFQDADRL